MPVSLSEWRVRIGTFVHWIREYEVKERRERLLKERIRRLKVLCERLEAEMGDSGEESEDDNSRQDGPDPKGCPHKTSNIQTQNEPFCKEGGKIPRFVGKEQYPQPDTFTKKATDDELLKEHQTSSGSCKKPQAESSILMAVKRSPVVPFVSRKYCITEIYEEKQMGESASSCHGPSLKSKTDLISGQIPPLSELLLLKSGDVELNPGPREATEWSLELEGELLSLVEEVPPKHYTRLCNALGVKHAQSKAILSENLLDVSNSLFEVICSWGVKQRDGTNYKRLLAEKLRSVHLDALGTKLVEGGYSTQDTPTQCEYK
eukprot:XP_011670304.1 PREDICTED: uncharacterized protein LOC105441133 [Strongylocentrotus purpuratus]